MTHDLFRRAREIFDEAVEVPPPERPSYLETACGGDARLRSEVEALLKSADRAGDFLETGPAASGRGILEPPETLPPPSRIGPYEIVRELGHGGMGTVYLGVRSGEGFERQVALKVIRRGMDTEFIVKRFLSERQILASLDHPYIAKLFDGGTTDDGLPYFVMEYIEGRPLTEYCEDRKLSIRERVGLFRKILSAVQYAHQHLVVHRDIKPGNLFIGEDGIPRLLDFGLAKLMDPTASGEGAGRTATLLRMLTPEYASPEQVRGERVTTASDVYSLGVVLYRLLTGRTPYRMTTGSPEEISRAVLEQEPGSVAKLLGEDLDVILRTATRKEAGRRYASAEQLSEDLRRYLAGLPIQARKDTLGYRTRKFISRHKVAVAAGVLVALSLVGGTGVALWQAKRAAEKEALAWKRFEDTRKLAHSILFEFYDAIKNVGGTTPAQELLVKRALEYLDRLAKEAGDDPSLRIELAQAYLRVGDVQGNIFSGNRGDSRGAKESYDRAAALVDALGDPRKRGTQDLAPLADAYGALCWAYMSTGELERAVAYGRKELALWDTLARRAEAGPPEQRKLAIVRIRLGHALRDSGAAAEAISVTRAAAETLEPLCAANPPDPLACRHEANAYNQIASMETGTDAAAGRADHEKALAIQKRLLQSDPSNAQLKRELAATYSDMAEALSLLGDPREASNGLREAIRLFGELVAVEPVSTSDRTWLAECQTELAGLQRREGKTPAARETLQEARSHLERILAADPANYNARRSLAAAYFSLGTTYLPPDPSHPLSRKDAATALSWLRKSAGIYESLKAAGTLNASEARDLDDLFEKIATCQAVLK